MQMDSQMRRNIEWEPEEEMRRVGSRRLLSPGASVTAVIHSIWMCSPVGSSLNPMLLGLYGGFIIEAWLTINSIFSLSSLPRILGVWLTVLSFSHKVVFLKVPILRPSSCLIRTKSTSITQNTTRILGTLCQKPRADTYIQGGAKKV